MSSRPGRGASGPRPRRPGGHRHVADVVPVAGENRCLVRLGLRLLADRPRPGLAAVIAAAGLGGADISPADVAFRLAPRINAMGRVGDPTVAARLLLARDATEAAELAEQLELANTLRRELTAEVLVRGSGCRIA